MSMTATPSGRGPGRTSLCKSGLLINEDFCLFEVITTGTGRYKQQGSCSRAPEPAALFGCN